VITEIWHRAVCLRLVLKKTPSAALGRLWERSRNTESGGKKHQARRWGVCGREAGTPRVAEIVFAVGRSFFVMGGLFFGSKYS